MNAKWTRRLFVGLLVLAAGGGCSPIQLISILSHGRNGSEVPPDHPLLPHLEEDEDEEDASIKVVTLVTIPGSAPSEFIGSHRTLAAYFQKHLKTSYESREKKIELVPQSEVEDYLNGNPDVRVVSPAQLGRHFRADYVIDVELTGLQMFEPGTIQLFQGKADVSVVVHDIVDGDLEFPPFDYVSRYPKVAPQMRGFETTTTTFRQKFLMNMARELAWKFVPHLREEERVQSQGLIE